MGLRNLSSTQTLRIQLLLEKLMKNLGAKFQNQPLVTIGEKRCGRVKELNFSNLENIEFAYLAGLFLADGCAYSEPRGAYAVIFSLSTQNDGNLIKYTANLLAKIGARPSIRVDGSETQVRVFSKRLYEIISPFQKPDFVCSFIRKLTLIEKLAFVGGLVDGDGNARRRRKNISIEFFQIKYRWLIPLFYNLFAKILGPNSVSVWRNGSSIYIKTCGVKDLLKRNLVFCMKLSSMAKRECLLQTESVPSTFCGAGEGI